MASGVRSTCAAQSVASVAPSGNAMVSPAAKPRSCIHVASGMIGNEVSGQAGSSMPRSNRLSTQEANRAAMSAANQAGISVDGYVEIARGTGIGDRHRPRCREAVGQIGRFDGKILKRKIVCGGNIVDDNVEQAMAPLSRDPKSLLTSSWIGKCRCG